MIKNLRIALLEKRKESLWGKKYNLSGSGWKDYYGEHGMRALFEHNDKIDRKMIAIDNKIAKIKAK